MTSESFELPTNADILLDTSAAIALVLASSELHGSISKRTHGLILGLSGHAAFETYSVLTRLPGAQRLSARTAARVIDENFPATHQLGARAAASALKTIAAANIAGGSVYDGLVGLAAKDAGTVLLSCDRRAQPTYAALAVATEFV
ncbi:PIN domain-containing protein [Paramicrobacterium agarici]|uniref:Ribonuclease VapC n=1 Tax=Paramicrobacterium agarici TaxID=630514 RepID=A0A2A9DTX3_9MICO|nr:PIN domain-containing protein [Microbacterium agarici]PFG30053.1 PIN domain-containing protein [Microbacterium agarici]